MKYIILFCYIMFFAWLGQELGDEAYQVAFIGGIVRATTANRLQKDLQRRAEAITPERPEYQIPQEVMDYLSNAMSMAQGDMPGYGRMMNRAAGTTANTLSQARNFADSGTSLLQSLGMAGESERRQMGNIDMQNAQFRQGNMNALQSALMNVAGYRDQAFDFNQVQPYIQQEMDKRAFEQAALNQRIAKGDAWASFADGVVNTGLTLMGMPTEASGKTLFGKIFGDKQKPSSMAGYRTQPAISAPQRPSFPNVNFNVPNPLEG